MIPIGSAMTVRIASSAAPTDSGMRPPRKFAGLR